MKRPWLWQVLVPLAGVALVLGGIIAVGQWTRDWLGQQPRTQVAFESLDCPAPPGQSREDFLGEVQYLGGLPSQLSLRDESLPARLSEAFARHPWVEAVDGVSIVPPGRVEVRLRFRTPVLAVRYRGQTRAVDAGAVLLPPSARCDGLPHLNLPDTAAMPGVSGTIWEDAKVQAAARAAALHR
jgi:hypothetical protein